MGTLSESRRFITTASEYSIMKAQQEWEGLDLNGALQIPVYVFHSKQHKNSI